MVAPLVGIAAKVGLRLAQTPQGRKIIGLTLAVGVAAPAFALGGLIVSTVSAVGAMAQAGGDTSLDSVTCSTPAPVAGDGVDTAFTVEQTGNAAVIVAVAKAADLGELVADADRERAAVIGVATSIQESSLRNLPGGDRDSIGLFQQRPSQAWGTPEQVGDPVYAATAFFTGAGTNRGLRDIAGWQSMDLAAAAQAVQHSANGALYGAHEGAATSLVTSLWSTTPAAVDLPTTRTAGMGVVPEPGAVTCPTDLPDGDLADLGYQNGQIPAAALCPIPWATDELLRCEAIQPLTGLNAAYAADHGGANLIISDAYRSLEGQYAAKEMWCERGDCSAAATPGTSNHGLGLAVDLGNFGSLGNFSSPNYAWMQAHAAAFGFVHPAYMNPGGSGPLEPWHWEFRPGTAAAQTAGASA